MNAQAIEARDQSFILAGTMLGALSSPLRLRIIQILSNKSSTVEELVQRTGEKFANVSQHLQKLSQARLVRFTKHGTSRIYELSDDSVLKLWLAVQETTEQLSPEARELSQNICPSDLASPTPLPKVLEQVEKKRAILIDVRESEEYEYRHVEGAHSIPASELSQASSTLPRSKTIYLYCRGPYCSLANAAVEKLRRKGFKAYRLKESCFEIAEQSSQ